MDLFEPGTGFTTQLHDYNPGVAPSGLVWTVQIQDSMFQGGGDSASVTLANLPLMDSFQFGGTDQVPGTVSFHITWVANGDMRHLRPGSSAPTDPTNLSAQFRDALATGTFSGQSVTMPNGVTFTFSGDGSSATTWGEMGTERNGWFLNH